MNAIFYIASIIAVIASMKVIICLRVDKAILYLAISLFATASIFILLKIYLSAILYMIFFIGGAIVLFMSVASLLKIKVDNVENGQRGISPKIWLGPLILAFILLVILIYGVVSTDYSQLRESHELMHEMSVYAYILMVELAIFLLLGAGIIAYHFMHRLLLEK
ncbi:NADH-quinone oxidoreductase subunit J [Gilliamella sp. ESL0405]|uniref:NADH-quinone oxidoreductase subunit J family protein n=1 Tax=Gilliamella sp. ESL0405 TaxID=2704653 RepID=UPI001C6A33E6|nr:NADH-quinone oxidoreductase subunit J [Gilliamella sp. ESL0405]QYN47573.1 NADH-quinone oxidoreductase subunit J [Gilliamella sp. ESL0405]